MAELSPLSQHIWGIKYRYRQPDGTPIDKTIEDSWNRVAAALAVVEPEVERSHWEAGFYRALTDFRFLPAGRILAGAGTDRAVTLFNCFVMGTIPDDMTGIFTHLREAALTLQQGGGIGYDFSSLRPKGAPVRGVGADASGPLSFMDVWDAMCRTIMSAGHRRGAMMATLRCDHPDIEAFIAAKREPGRLRMFNLSVLITDAFMQAVQEGRPWTLSFDGTIYRTIEARDLWDRIMRATYEYAEPGVVFIDRINHSNNLYYCETIQATNPCGEQPLPPYGACLLGSVNLATLIIEPFSDRAQLDIAGLSDLVNQAVRMMDNAIDISKFPLPQQEAEAKAKRRIGLGVTGLADALLMCKLRYGSDSAIERTKHWLHTVQRAAYLASIQIAKEKGAFPLFDKEKFLSGETISRLDEDIRKAIGDSGIRNALLTSIAPTGTISLFAGNVSSGIEPVFSFHYIRHILMPDGTRQAQEVNDYAYRLFRRLRGEEAPLPDYFVDAQTLSPIDHIRMQSAVQQYIDSSISKTINCPADLPFEAFQDVYWKAYEMGCKGCTTYRPNAITGAVLETQPAKREPSSQQSELPLPEPGLSVKPKDVYEAGGAINMTRPLDRPEVLPGCTYKLNWPESEHALYITLNDIIQDGRRRPFEIFINSKNLDHYAWTLGLTRMISAVFRRGGDVRFVAEELKAVFDPRGGGWVSGRYVPSLLAAIGGVIEHHMVTIGLISDSSQERQLANRAAIAAAQDRTPVLGIPQPGGSSLAVSYCPKCGSYARVRQEGCEACLDCGYSKCG